MLKHYKLSKILRPVLLTTPFWDSLCRRVNLVLQRKDLLQLCTERKLNIFWLDFKISSRWESESFKFRIRRNIYVLVLITEGFHYRPQTKFAKVMFLHLSVSHSVHRGSTWAGTPLGRYTPQAGTPLGRYTPWQVHPLAGTPPGRYSPPVHAGIWSTSRQYTSYWNAFLLQLHCHSMANIRWRAQMKPLWCQSKMNKHVFQ